ncbi:MAG: ATP-binding cassette domain-containing protein [Patescibacteria group bacterium]|nr:ATP-binding cassette domain-containing protein [Patescibacteria group bacterium]
MIELFNISKKYKGKTVLDNIDLSIQGRDFVSVIGPSGAGKSTLLHILLGTERPSKGIVQIDEFNITKMKNKALHELRRKIGIITQDDMLLPEKTVYENVAFALEISGYKKSYIKSRTSDVLEIVGMIEDKKSFPRQLSAGERKKVAIARAFVVAPQLLIADEPTASLDPESAHEIVKLLLEINSKGTTVILATHHKSLVDFANKRVIRLEAGRIVSDKKESGYHHK